MSEFPRIPKKRSGRFDGSVYLASDPGRNDYRVTRELAYVTADGLRIRVPRNTRTDLASVPWFCRWLFDDDGDVNAAAVVHDWLYRRQGFVISPPLSRRQCDAIFREALEVCLVIHVRRYRLLQWKSDVWRWFRKWAMWLGVRIGGWWAWHFDT